jgi:hypothetical protein
LSQDQDFQKEGAASTISYGSSFLVYKKTMKEGAVKKPNRWKRIFLEYNKAVFPDRYATDFDRQLVPDDGDYGAEIDRIIGNDSVDISPEEVDMGIVKSKGSSPMVLDDPPPVSEPPIYADQSSLVAVTANIPHAIASSSQVSHINVALPPAEIEVNEDPPQSKPKGGTSKKKVSKAGTVTDAAANPPSKRPTRSSKATDNA